MQKKYAHFLVMNGLPAIQTADFEANGILYTVFGLPTLEDGVALAGQCAAGGYGVITLCGAFTPDWAERVTEAAGPDVGVGVSSAMAHSQDAFIRFFDD